MARHVMTPARRAALRKAQIASARKRRKGFKGKVKTFAKTTRPKGRANKQLRKASFSRMRAESKKSKTRKKTQKANRIAKGTQGAYKKRRKATRKKARANYRSTMKASRKNATAARKAREKKR